MATKREWVLTPTGGLMLQENMVEKFTEEIGEDEKAARLFHRAWLRAPDGAIRFVGAADGQDPYTPEKG